MPRPRKPPPRYHTRLRADCNNLGGIPLLLRKHDTLESAALHALTTDHYEVFDTETKQRWSLAPQGPRGARTGIGSHVTVFGGSVLLLLEPSPTEEPEPAADIARPDLGGGLGQGP